MSLVNNGLSRRSKIFYGVGDFGINLADTMVSLLFAIFLTDVVGLRPALAAIAVFIGRTSDYVNDPLIGYLSDQTKSRWGRRRPFILFGIIPFLIAYTLLWWIPPFSSQVLVAVYYGFAFLFYDTAATVIYMPYFALTPELTQSYDERTTLTSYRMFFSILGGMIGFVVPLALIGTMDPENARRVLMVGAGVGLTSVIPLILVFFGTRERPESQLQERPSFIQSFLAAVKNKTFVYSLVIFTFTWMALDILQSTLLYFLKHRMNLSEESDIILGLFYAFALVSIPFWNWAAKHWNKQKAYIAGMVFLALVTISMGLARPEWGLVGMSIFGVLAGFGLGAVQILTWAMIPDGVEVDELETGQRHEGMFYSLVTTVRKVAASLSLPLILLVLDWSGYDPNLVVQPTPAIRGIQALIGPIPSLFLLVGIIFAIHYPLSRERHTEITKELENRRGVKE